MHPDFKFSQRHNIPVFPFNEHLARREAPEPRSLRENTAARTEKREGLLQLIKQDGDPSVGGYPDRPCGRSIGELYFINVGVLLLPLIGDGY